MDLPLHTHTGSCKKSDVMGPSKYFGIKYLFSFLHPYSTGDLDGGLASSGAIHPANNLKAELKFTELETSFENTQSKSVRSV
jgi:hypothetical protein